MRAGPLTPARITAAAIALADAAGIEAVTMRRLATALGTATAGLYRHFPSRTALIAAMADTAAGGSRPPPDTATGWRARLEHEAREEWRLYRRHPWLLRVLATTRPPLEPGVLAAAERSVAAARDAGLPAPQAMAAYLAVSGLVQGLALLPAAESAAASSGPDIEEWWRGEADTVAALAQAGGLPHLRDQCPAAPFTEFDALFESALATLLDGVAAQLTPPNK